MSLFPEEVKLIELARKGNSESFETLISPCKKQAYNIAFRYLNHEEDAKDAIQEALLKAYRNLDKFQMESKFSTWLYRIVVNTCTDMLRKRKDTLHILNEDEEGPGFMAYDLWDTAPGPEDQIMQKEVKNKILDCLERVGPDHKEILILRDVNGLSYDEIAEILECSIGTVKSRISRARHSFKQLWEQLEKTIV